MNAPAFSTGRVLLQAAGIGVVALALGAVHAQLAPVQLTLSVAPVPTPAVTPAKLTSAPAPTPIDVPAVAPAPKAEGLVTLEHVLALMQSSPVQFVDARAQHEFAASRIPGAVHLSPDMFAMGAPATALALDRSLPIVVYCTGGQCESSLLVAIRLREMGYGQLSVYEDGFEGWTKAGQAVDSTPAAGGGLR